MTLRLGLFVILLGVPVAAARPAAPVLLPSQVAAIDALFAQEAHPDSPGCAVGVYRAGDVVFARGYGMASIEHAGPISPRTPFNVASLSKQFTGYAIQLLARDGKLDLDSDIRRHLPGFPDVGAPVTVRHLLHHTSGLRAYEALYTLLGWNRDHPLSRQQALDIIYRQRSTGFRPGEQHQYGNTNYVLLAEIVEAVDGRPLDVFLAEEVFVPLGMTSTQVRTDPLAVIPGRAETYWKTDAAVRRNHLWAFAHATGASNVITTVEDLARWNGEFHDERVGGDGIAETMYAPTTLTSGERPEYGSGIYAGMYRGSRVVGHSGGAGGDYAFYRFPDHKLAAAVLCNFEGPDAPGRAFAILEMLLADALGPGDAAADGAAGGPGTKALLDAWTPDAEALERYTGTYRSEELGVEWVFSVRGDALVVRRPRFVDQVLEPKGPGAFELAVPFEDLTWPVDLAFAADGERAESLAVTTHRATGIVFERVDRRAVCPDCGHGGRNIRLVEDDPAHIEGNSDRWVPPALTGTPSRRR